MKTREERESAPAEGARARRITEQALAKARRLGNPDIIYDKAVAPVLKEFKAFIMRGNVLDLAVGVIMGAAFGKITSSLVGDIIMPLIGVVLGGVDFTTLNATVPGLAGEVVVPYGMFIQTVVDFLIIALAVFFLVKILTTRRKKAVAAPPPAPPAPSKEELLLAEIRDLLKEANRKTRV